MKYYIFIYYLISYSTGFACLTLLIIIYLKYKIQTILYNIIWLAAFTGTLILSNAEFYRITILYQYNTYSNIWAIFIHHFLYGIMFYTMPLIFHKLLDIKFSLLPKIVFGSMFLFTLILVFIPCFYTSWEAVEAAINGFKINTWIIIGINFYLFLLSLFQLRNIKVKEKKLFIIISIILFGIFIPLWILEYYWNFNALNILRPLSLENLFYFIWNMIMVVFMAKYLFAGTLHILADDIPEDIIRQFGITPREKEIVIMIARGFTNKMMASALGIATLTVRNHVYNIYQKTKAKSKIDLINLLNHKRQTIESKIIAIFPG